MNLCINAAFNNKIKANFCRVDIVYGGSFRTYDSNIMYFLLSQAKENVVLFFKVKINPFGKLCVLLKYMGTCHFIM